MWKDEKLYKEKDNISSEEKSKKIIFDNFEKSNSINPFASPCAGAPAIGSKKQNNR